MQAQPDQIRLCQKGPDHNKDIIMVCLNPECDAIRLCCLTCVDQFHRKHQLVSLHKFQQMLSQLSDKQRPEAKLPIIQVIQQYKKSLHDQLQQLLKRMINEFRETQKQLDSVFKNVFDLLQSPTANISIIQDFYENFNSKCAQKYLKKIKDSNNINFASQKMITQITQRAQVCFKKGLLDFEKLYSKNLQQIKKGIIIIKKSLLQDKFVPWTKKFSKTNKAACLALDQNDMKTKRFQGAGGYPINLIEQPLTKQNNSVSFKITEQPGNKGIWMGVCALQIVKSFNFLSCYGIGKGTWAIDQVGQNHQSAYSWNHHDTNFNSQPKVGWQFNLGDTVTISVNFDKSTVSFNRGLDKYQQPIKLDLGQIYAFAGPTNLGDSIILV